MKIEMIERGGLAAAVRKRPRVLETSSLNSELRARVEALARAALAQSPREVASPMPDRMSYRLAIDTGAEVCSLSVSETNLAPEVADLIDIVQQMGKNAP